MVECTCAIPKDVIFDNVALEGAVFEPGAVGLGVTIKKVPAFQGIFAECDRGCAGRIENSDGIQQATDDHGHGDDNFPGCVFCFHVILRISGDQRVSDNH